MNLTSAVVLLRSALPLLHAGAADNPRHGARVIGLASITYVDTDMAAWRADTIPAATMVPVADVVAAVDLVLGLNRNTSITRIVLSRSGTSGHVA